MGLSIFVGLLAREVAENTPLVEPWKKNFLALNAVLADAGQAAHNEPLVLGADQYFDAEMIGYSGIHDIRRLAIYHLSGSPLPAPAHRDDRGDDPLVDKVYAEIDALILPPPPRKGGLFSLFKKETPPAKKKMPRFQHLLLHSDAEGFYLPRDFEDVVVDFANPQREALAGWWARPRDCSPNASNSPS